MSTERPASVRGSLFTGNFSFLSTATASTFSSSTFSSSTFSSSSSSSASSSSTASSSPLTQSLSASFLGSDNPASSSVTASGWMYWKREHGCWLKVFAVLRHELLWLSRSDARVARRSPLLQIAVASAEVTSIGGICVHGPSGETMELFPYDAKQTDEWFDALQEAAQLTLSFERAVAVQPLPRRQWKAIEPMYTGTLVEYHAQRRPAAWRRILSGQKLRDAWRRRLERAVDRLDQ